MNRWLIVGLGNPGVKYASTRHNAGFMLIDRLAGLLRVSFVEKSESLIGKGIYEGKEVILQKPLTYMNASGRAVKKLLDKAGLLRDGEIHNLIVAHDDIDLAAGVLRIRKGGSSGGHRGVDSIISETGSGDFIRIKIGVGRDSLVPAEEYVLQSFRPDEKKIIEEALSNAVGAVEMILNYGIEKAMNKYNRPPKKDERTIT